MADARKRRLQILTKDLFSAFWDEAAQTPKGALHDVYANVATVLEALHFGLAAEDRKALGAIAKAARATKKKQTAIAQIREGGVAVERFSTTPGMLKTSDAAAELVRILERYTAVAKPYFALVKNEKDVAATLAADLRAASAAVVEARVAMHAQSSELAQIKEALSLWGNIDDSETQADRARQTELRKSIAATRRRLKKLEAEAHAKKAAYAANAAVRSMKARDAVIDAVIVHLNTNAHAYGPRLGSSEEAEARIGAELDAIAKRPRADGERLATAALVGWCGDATTREHWRQIVRQRRS